MSHCFTTVLYSDFELLFVNKQFQTSFISVYLIESVKCSCFFVVIYPCTNNGIAVVFKNVSYLVALSSQYYFYAQILLIICTL